MQEENKAKIPKILHYIWLGNNPEPKILEKCKKSWKKFCPDYEIKRWDESNLNIDINSYCRQAYDNKKYAFASDVLRFDVLYNNGGIYLDVDVELLKNLDEFLSNDAFCGFELKNLINPGLIYGCKKNDKNVKNLIDIYNKEAFVIDNKLNLKTVCERTTQYFLDRGLKCNDEIESVGSTTIYPVRYFNPTNLSTQKVNIKKETALIHHYSASWYTPKMKFKRFIKTFLNKVTFGLFGKIFLKK